MLADVSGKSSYFGRLQQENMRIRPGPTGYDFCYASLFVPYFFNEPIQRNIQKCTIPEAQRVTGDSNWRIYLDEVGKFLGIITARRVGLLVVKTCPSSVYAIGCRDVPCLAKLCLETSGVARG